MIGFVVILTGIVLDRLVKFWAVEALAPKGTIPLIPDVFHLTYVENRGAAFSLLEDHQYVFIIVSAAALAFLAGLLLFKKIRWAPMRWASWLILSGGVGNLIDRLWQGYVVDLFDLRLINFAVFNVADIFITVGTIGLAFCVLLDDFVKRRAEKKAQAASPAAPDADASSGEGNGPSKDAAADGGAHEA